MSKQYPSPTVLRQSIKSLMVTGLSATVLASFSLPTFAKGNPNVDCPEGTTQAAKYEWNGSYQAEGDGSAVTILSGATATSGSWTATQNISAVVIKGGSGPGATDTITYDPVVTSGDFSNEGLVNGGENTPDISNIKFCAGSGTLPPTSNVCDFVYAVHDGGLNNSQIVKIDASLNFTPLGPEYPGHDLEALDMSPSTVLYAASGRNVDNGKPGHLYTVDMTTGSLTEVGDIGHKEIDGISFNPVDGTLWGWTPQAGLLTIDPGTAASTVVLAATGELEDLTWNSTGETLYAAYNDSGSGPDKTAGILAYDGTSLTSVCDTEISTLVGDGEIEALEMLPDGNLAFGYNNTGNQPWAAVVNFVDCNITPVSLAYHAPLYNDIEGIAACIP